MQMGLIGRVPDRDDSIVFPQFLSPAEIDLWMRVDEFVFFFAFQIDRPKRKSALVGFEDEQLIGIFANPCG